MIIYDKRMVGERYGMTNDTAHGQNPALDGNYINMEQTI